MAKKVAIAVGGRKNKVTRASILIDCAKFFESSAITFESFAREMVV
jgi:hypothetical protein